MSELSKCQDSLNKLMEYNFELENMLSLKNQAIEDAKNNDTLTGVLNNEALVKKLNRSDTSTYILLNMDNFSNINSAYGYETGNDTLIEIVRLLKISKPYGFEIYRFCADKFVLLDEGKYSNQELQSIAESILSFFNASTIMIDDEIPIPVSFSIGIATARGTLAITQAELALKEIRRSRKNYYYIYDQKLENPEVQQENVYWINRIKESILDEDVVVHYQPLMNNKTKKIEKYECLSRIYDEGRYISPFAFMDAASETRVLHLMTQSVIQQAFKKFANTSCEFSINITKDDLYMNYLEKYLLKYCSKYKINPSRVVLEILEDITSLTDENILEQLHAFRLSGFQIAIDDFGAEHSNFSRLLEFKPDYLKIDGVFIKNIENDINSRWITESISDICKKSDIKVIAEFIHNESVQKIIEDIGIEYSQGYYIGAPSTELVE